MEYDIQLNNHYKNRNNSINIQIIIIVILFISFIYYISSFSLSLYSFSTKMFTTVKSADTEAVDAEAADTEAADTEAANSIGTKASSTSDVSSADINCVEQNSLGRCENCLHNNQCKKGYYCCPYMKKCVNSSTQQCSIPIADCRPMCYDNTDINKCKCSNPDFPNKWQNKTCTGAGTSTGNHDTPGLNKVPKDYNKRMLDYHNNIRKQCSSENKTMKWNQNLANYAQKYATKLALENSCNLSHSFEHHDSYSEINSGENLAMYGSTAGVNEKKGTEMAINGWAGEGYGSGKDPDAKETGHYTAMNWDTTTEVGCGYGINREKNCIVTSCNYTNTEPNIIGQYDKHVKCNKPIQLKI